MSVIIKIQKKTIKVLIKENKTLFDWKSIIITSRDLKNTKQ